MMLFHLKLLLHENTETEILKILKLLTEMKILKLLTENTTSFTNAYLETSQIAIYCAFKQCFRTGKLAYTPSFI